MKEQSPLLSLTLSSAFAHCIDTFLILFLPFSLFLSQYPVMREEAEPDPEKLKKLHEALGWLDGHLAGHDWAVGDHITVADHALVASVSTFEAAEIDIARHQNVAAWLARCKSSMPGYKEENQRGIDETKEYIKKLQSKK